VNKTQTIPFPAYTKNAAKGVKNEKDDNLKLYQRKTPES
jgi:hypothetical protein